MTRLIVMGASLGGVAALKVLLQGLQAEFAIPIVIVQHRHRSSKNGIVEFLQCYSKLNVKEVEDKDEIAAGWIYLAPADYHLLVEPHHFVLSTDEPVSYARPSIDVLFESAADAHGEQTVGVVLTGANQDGTAGAAAIKARGGKVIVQDPTNAECAVMPASVLAQTKVDWILPLNQIASQLNALNKTMEAL